MEIPLYLKKDIKKYAELNEQARFLEREVIAWMQKNKIIEETAIDVTRDMNDLFIDWCQMTNNADAFIKVIEGLEVN